MTPHSISDEQIFSDALARPLSERAVFLDGACHGDAALHARISALLAAHDGPESVMTSSPVTRPAPLPDLSAVGSAKAEEKPGDRIGHYKLLQQIGEGGCGVVYMAEQEEPVRRRVALKIIKLGMDTKAVVARFEAERQALAMMDHANIAKVHDAGATATGRLFFVMELVRGVPITKYCDEGQLTPTARLELFIKVCHAIQHAHQKGIIHRDIKPSNILVTVNDGVPTPKVIDFGIAKATQGRLTDATVFTAFEQFIGTPVYMSPEQAEISSVDIDTRSDIYSLGVLLYELLTGRPPFDPKAFAQAGVDQIRQQIREVEPQTPSRRLHTISDEERTTIARLRGTAPAQLSLLLRGDLDWIVMRCLEKDRTRRYDTANGLALDIQRHLRNEPVVARPPSTAYLLQKLIRRHRLGFAAALAITTTVVTGAIFSTWQAVRATRAEQTAKTARDAEARLRQVAETQGTIARQRAYAADMQLVQQALDGDNLYRARELLDRQKPLAGQQDLRGWEWRYLWQFCRSDALGEFCQKPSSIRALSLSGDGQWLAMVGGRPRVSVWNIATREEIAVPVTGEGRFVVFAPRGPLLAAASSGSENVPEATRHPVVIWNVETRQALRELHLGGECGGLSFSDDGQTLVTSTLAEDNQITLWRVADGSVIRRIPAPRNRLFEGTPFAATTDLNLVAHGTPGQQLRVVDTNSGLERWSQEGAARGNFVTALAFSADGRLLASGAGFEDPAIRLWDAATGKMIRLLEGHQHWVAALIFWPDGKTLASAGTDRTIRVWDVASGRLLNTLRGEKLEVWRLALLPDRATLISGGKSGAVSLWNALAPRNEDARTQLPVPVASWRFANDSKSILTVENDGRVARWHGRGFRETKAELNLGPIATNFPSLTEISPDLRFVALKRNNTAREVEVWDATTGSLRYKFPAAANTFPSAVFMDRHTLRVFDERNADTMLCREWDLKSGKATQTWRIPVRGTGIVGVTFSPDGQQCIASPYSGPALVYDLRTGLDSPVAQIPALASPKFSSDGTLLATPLSGLHVVKLRETSTYREVAALSSMMRVPHSVAFSPDGTRLAVGAAGREAIALWNTQTREPVLALEKSGSLKFIATAFSPDGNCLGSRSTLGSENHGILHLWRAPSWEEIAQAEKAQEASAKKP